MRIKRSLIAAMLAVIVAVASTATGAVAIDDPTTETQVAAAATAYFESGTTFHGIPLQSSNFGIGVVVYSNGAAVGNVEIELSGTTPLDQTQKITVVGNVAAGTVNVDGTVSFSGTGTLDMGDGSFPLSVPFTVVLTTSGLQLTIDTTALPTLPVSDGSIFIG
jgi:hypothetical protein